MANVFRTHDALADAVERTSWLAASPRAAQAALATLQSHKPAAAPSPNAPSLSISPTVRRTDRPASEPCGMTANYPDTLPNVLPRLDHTNPLAPEPKAPASIHRPGRTP